MKDKFSKTYLIFTTINILISSLISIIVELFVVYNLSKLLEIEKISRVDTKLEFLAEPNIYSNVLYYIIGIIVFTICFMILEKHNVSLYIYNNMKKMTDRINELMDKERENEKSKNDLITNVAHDLRTPLTSIIGYIELLKYNSKNIDDETREKYIDIAYTKAKRLQMLLEELFSFTKTTYRGENIVINKIDIIALLNQLLDETYPLFEKNNLTYELTSSENKIFINADGNLLARLFENLFSNAIKYGVDGKRIVVKVSNNTNDNTVKIDVINFGKVIPQNEISKIFDQFYRTDVARQSKTGGTGLGLAIAKNIAKMHDGDITVESNEKGTDFIVVLKTNIEKSVLVKNNNEQQASEIDKGTIILDEEI